MEEKQSFLRNHADTLAIIGINVGFMALSLSLWISHASRIDQLYGTIIQLLQK